MKRFILGPRALAEALAAHASEIAEIMVTDAAAKAHTDLLTKAERARIHIAVTSSKLLDDLVKDSRHQGILGIAKGYQYVHLEDLLEPLSEQTLLVALDEITDPHNFGAVLRSAVAFGAQGIITLKDRAAPVTSAVVRTSAGATEHARIARVTNLAQTLTQLSKAGLQTIGLAAEASIPITELPPAPLGRVLVLGSEGHGLRRLVRERCEILAHIPMTGPLASLNASVAAGIALYQVSRLERGGR